MWAGTMLSSQKVGDHPSNLGLYGYGIGEVLLRGRGERAERSY
jgi:hypothetical protein